MKKWIISLLTIAMAYGLYLYLFQNADSILTISNCTLPCWNNITPGLTQIEDAKLILENTPEVGRDNVRIYDYKREMFFHLFLEKPGINPEALCNVQYDDLNIVKQLDFFGSLTITAEEIFQEIGPPEYIISTPFGGGGTVFVAVYPSTGVAFSLTHREKVFEPGTKVSRLLLFDTLDYERILNAGRFSEGELDGRETIEMKYPWKGYGKIEELYPPRAP